MPIIEKHAVLTGETIRVARLVRGLSQRKLGQACGLALWQVWQIENGVRKARPEELIRLWNVLSTGAQTDRPT
jgi:transcriptional regulator with XRE-family HTH domain